MFFEIERVGRILKDLEKYRYPKKIEFENFYIKEGDFSSVEMAEGNSKEWRAFQPGETWGGSDNRYWFKGEITIPQEYVGKTVVLEINTGREGEWDALNPQFLFYLDRKIVQGFDTNHREAVICNNAEEGSVYRIDLHGYAGMQGEEVKLRGILKVLDRETEKLYYDIKVPLEVAELLHKEDKRRIDIINHLVETINLLDLRKPHSELYYESLQEAQRYITEEFYSRFCGEEICRAVCLGHTHIDVAWLWTLRQTREKVARSFSTVLNLMEEYPEYIFMSSQPQLYKYLKEDHPELYSKIKEKVAEGKWEAEGGMWLEADCNLASGESLIRQILFGKRFFKEEFGVDSKILWLPDVFGYSEALPQILKRFNMEYFMTTKISWNEYNKIPYDTFMWEGIDGSSVLSYFITTIDYKSAVEGSHRTRYEGILGPSEVNGAWHRYQQKNINDEILISYGHGDGGGGPTKEMLENARRLEKGIPGAPTVKRSSAIEFFEELNKRVCDNPHLPKWVGELYLEYHRGTYTTMGRNKRYNRKSEFLYQDIELFNVINSLSCRKATYPQNAINQGWEKILLNQFHDIIPGSSIKEVYEESKEDYEKLIREGKNLLQMGIDSITEGINAEEKSLVVFNQLSYSRDDVVIFNIPKWMSKDRKYEITDGGTVHEIQSLGDQEGIVYVQGIPSKGYKTYCIKEKDCVKEESHREEELRVSPKEIRNRFFHLKINENGEITSIFDRMNRREVLQAGERGNILQVFEDKPHLWDAWDINIYYREKMWEINELEDIQVISHGPVMGVLKIRRRFLDSTVTQWIKVYRDIARIDFENEIDWKESHMLLKVAFPVDVHANKATYDIQYGNVERETHWNTSWDAAKFEVCAHKWADLSEGDFGVSLLNDCKYGHDIKDGVMRLTLLKSPLWPNPDADKEKHKFVYSLYPHKGDWKVGKTVQQGYNLNCPFISKVKKGGRGTLHKEFSFVKVDRENVIVESVKKAEDSGDIIIRMYECYNIRTDVSIYIDLSDMGEGGKGFSLYECDLNEEELYEMEKVNAQFKFSIKPYEVRTFKIRPSKKIARS